MNASAVDVSAQPSAEVDEPIQTTVGTKRSRKSDGRSNDSARRERQTAELLSKARDEQLSGAERDRCLELAVAINVPVADALARRYRSRGEDLDDLIQVARLGLIQAVKRFDPDSGAFLPFAVPTITGEIKRHFRDHCWTVRPPRRLQELHSDVMSAWAELAQEQSSTPTAAEIADWLGADRADVLEAMRSNAFSSSSLDTSDGLSRAATAVGTQDAGFEAVEDQIEHEELMDEVRHACETLCDEDRELLRMRFVEGCSQSVIAEKLGISQMSVSRRLRKITKSLRHEVTRHARVGSPAERTLRSRRLKAVPQQPTR